jgi:hypothetical protein
MHKIIRLVAVAAFAVPAVASAIELMPDYSGLPAGWVTDRYEPASFSNVGVFQGRNDVLGIAISDAQSLANRPAGYQSAFYNTQGRQHAVSGGVGSTLSADLWIDASWEDAANGSVRTDMWGIMTDGAAVSEYPIIGFTNYGGSARLRFWDSEVPGAWVDLATPINYGAWNAFSIEFTGLSLVYSVNGAVVGTDNTVNGSTGFTAVIMQAYNFGDPGITGATLVDYTAHWSNAQPGNVPDGAATAGLLGFALLALASLRRRLLS